MSCLSQEVPPLCEYKEIPQIDFPKCYLIISFQDNFQTIPKEVNFIKVRWAGSQLTKQDSKPWSFELFISLHDTYATPAQALDN